MNQRKFLLVLVLAVLGSCRCKQDNPSRILAEMSLSEKLSLMHGSLGTYVGNVAGIERLGVPPVGMNDGPQVEAPYCFSPHRVESPTEAKLFFGREKKLS